MTLSPETPPPVMPDIEYSGRSFVDADTEHLKILTICWYVMAGLTALFGFFPFIYVFMGIAMMNEKFGPPAGAPGAPGNQMVGIMFIVMGCMGIAFLWTMALLALLTTRSLARRKRLILCYVTSAVACLQIPFGTLLGVFTFVVLARSSARGSIHRRFIQMNA